MYLQILNEYNYTFFIVNRGKFLNFSTVYAKQRALSPALLDFLYTVTSYFTLLIARSSEAVRLSINCFPT